MLSGDAVNEIFVELPGSSEVLRFLGFEGFAWFYSNPRLCLRILELVDDPVLCALDLSQNQSRLSAAPSSASIRHQRYLQGQFARMALVATLYCPTPLIICVFGFSECSTKIVLDISRGT